MILIIIIIWLVVFLQQMKRGGGDKKKQGGIASEKIGYPHKITEKIDFGVNLLTVGEFL